MISFMVIAFFAVGASVFLIQKGSEAANEIELLNQRNFSVRRELIMKELDEKEGFGTAESNPAASTPTSSD